MPQSDKARLLFLRSLFLAQTDDQHALTTQQLLGILSDHGFEVERRTVYRDIRALVDSGLDIVSRRAATTEYFVRSRTFSLAEVKLLMDAIQSCRFLSAGKSDELIEKLCTLTSAANARELSRQVYVKNRVKTDNARIYANVDALHGAIHIANKIRFRYCQYNELKQLIPRRGGERYEVSPYLVTWADDNYYLIGDSPHHDGLAHYRVDKMCDVEILPAPRKKLDPLFDPVQYVNSMFSMYAGEREWVEIAFHKSLIGVVIDRFGTDVTFYPIGDDCVLVNTLVSVSPAFFGWIAQFGEKAEIRSPSSVRERMHRTLDSADLRYGEFRRK